MLKDQLERFAGARFRKVLHAWLKAPLYSGGHGEPLEGLEQGTGRNQSGLGQWEANGMGCDWRLLQWSGEEAWTSVLAQSNGQELVYVAGSQGGGGAEMGRGLVIQGPNVGFASRLFCACLAMPGSWV